MDLNDVNGSADIDINVSFKLSENQGYVFAAVGFPLLVCALKSSSVPLKYTRSIEEHFRLLTTASGYFV